MKILIACPTKLLHADLDSGDIGLVESNRPEYYGVSWTLDGRQLCLSHSRLDNAMMSSLESYIDSEVGHLSLGSQIGPDGLSQPHQILCTEGHIIATNTGRNCITVFEKKSLFYRHYWLEAVRWDRKGKSNECGSHFNSVFLHGKKLYVVAHNFDRGSDVCVLDWPSMTLIRRWKTAAVQAHNLWVTDEGQILVCDSMQGAILEVMTNEVLWRCDEPNAMTRGLACDRHYLYVGRSEWGWRRDRVKSDGGIWVIDRRTWKTRDYLHLPGAGNVNELRLLDRPDFCHHRIPFQGQLPLEPYVPEPVAVTDTHFCAMDSRPQEWTDMLGDWTRVEEQVVARDFSLAYRRAILARDMTVSAHVDVRHATTNFAGVVARYQGPGDTNLVTAMLHREGEHTSLQLWVNVGGTWSQMASHSAHAHAGRLELECCGDTLCVSFDGQHLLHGTCRELQQGTVGIRACNGSIAEFRVDTPVHKPVVLRVG